MKENKFLDKNIFIIIFSGTVLLSFIIWLSLIFANGVEAPGFDMFYIRCQDFLADSVNVIGYSAERDVYNNEVYTGIGEKAYPPLTYMLFYMFSRIVNIEKYYKVEDFLPMYMEPRFLIIYMIIILVTFVLLYEIVRNYIKDDKGIFKVLISTAVIVSQPMLFSIERGNTIIMTLLFVLIFILYYDSDNKILKEMGLISLAIAASFKMTPALLGVLLLYNKQWKDAVRTIIYGVVIFLLPFLFFKGGFDNIALMIRNMQSNLEYYTSNIGCTLYASLINYGFQECEVNSNLCDVFTKFFSILLLATPVFYDKKWKKVLCVSIVMVVLPSHSGYYCILYLIPAILLFLDEKKHDYKDYLYLLAFIIIMCDYGAATYINYHLSIIIILLLIVRESGNICIDLLENQKTESSEE